MQEQARQLKRPFTSIYMDHAPLDAFVSQQWDRVPGPTVIKAHEIGPAALAAVQSGQAKAVCTFRDPRDCVASDLVFLSQGIDSSIRRVANTLEYLKMSQTTSHILLVRYENMMAYRRREIRRIAEHLGIRVDEPTIERIDTRTNIEATKAVCSKLKDRPANSVINIGSHRVDPETHLHENHISNAMIGRWKTELTPEQGRWLTEFFSPWLLSLGYETPESLRAILTDTAVSPVKVPTPEGGSVAVGS